MTIPVWPAGLPYASTNTDFGIDELDNPVLETEMNSGTVRQRRKYSISITLMKLGIEMSNAQLAVFDAFYASIGNGAARFSMPVWKAGAYVNRNVSIVGGKVGKSQIAVSYQKVMMTVRIENL